MNRLSPLFCLGAFVANSCLAVPPSYQVAYLGEAQSISGMNDRGDVIGMTSSGGNVVGWVSRSGGPVQPLPLPPGMVSSWVVDINDAGEIVGSVSETFSAYDWPYAAIWRPGPAEYEVELLGALAGHPRSMATAINNAGDVLGDSRSGMFRYPVLFTADGNVDLSATGIFDPIDVNNERVVLAGSKRLDLGTMIVDDIGTPEPHYIATRGAEINVRGDVAASAISNSQHCTSTPALYTEGSGWDIIGLCSSYNGAHAINDRGDVLMMVMPNTLVRFADEGTFFVQELLDPSAGDWSISSFVGSDIDNSRRIAIIAQELPSGRYGAILLTPVGLCRADLTGDGTLNIFDFLAFQTAFSEGDLAADFSDDGQLNVFDFLAFQTAFGEGC